MRANTIVFILILLSAGAIRNSSISEHDGETLFWVALGVVPIVIISFVINKIRNKDWGFLKVATMGICFSVFTMTLLLYFRK